QDGTGGMGVQDTLHPWLGGVGDLKEGGELVDQLLVVEDMATRAVALAVATHVVGVNHRSLAGQVVDELAVALGVVGEAVQDDDQPLCRTHGAGDAVVDLVAIVGLKRRLLNIKAALYLGRHRSLLYGPAGRQSLAQAED